jgi:Asp-tRNA(Asn)/Glu-tRNA(Gln) amidotransferase C subunit
MSKSQIGAALIHLALELRISQRNAALRDARMEHLARKFTSKLSRVEKRLDDIEQVDLENQQITAEVLKRSGERRMQAEQFNGLYDQAQQTAKDRLYLRQQQRRAAAINASQGQGGGREASRLWQL